MKHLILALLLLTSGAAEAVTLPTSSSVISGGGPTTALSSQSSVPLGNIDSAGFVKICGGTNSASANGFYGLYSQTSPSANVSYSVPAAKKFYATRMDFPYSNSANSYFQLVYGTSAVPQGDGSAGPPFGVVYYGSSASAVSAGYTNASVAAYSFDMTGVTFPASSFPVFKAGQATVYQICIVGIVK